METDRKYSSEEIANQIDRLKGLLWDSGKENSPIIVVGPWAPKALAYVREARLTEVQRNYQGKLSRTGLWTPEDIIRPDELLISRNILSRRSKIALAAIADTEREIDAYREAGEIVFTTPAILNIHRDWSDEEARHDIIAGFAKKIILGEEVSEIEDIVAQIKEEGEPKWDDIRRKIKESYEARWSHEDHPGLDTEAGHGLFIPQQEDLTAKADEGADNLAYQDNLRHGINQRAFGACRIYRAIRPEEVRHSHMGINRSKIEFSLTPEKVLAIFSIVREGFIMPGESFINGARRLAVILYGGKEGYLGQVNGSFDKTIRTVFGLQNPEDIGKLEDNISELNRNLTTPGLRVVKKDTSLVEYKAAA